MQSPGCKGDWLLLISRPHYTILHMSDPNAEITSQELEKIKLLSEHSKHMTTVATASVLAMFAFITKLTTLHWKLGIALAAAALFVSLCSSLFAHGYLVERFVGNPRRRNIGQVFSLSYIAFIVGILFLLICVIINVLHA